jgi:hypothetical protein
MKALAIATFILGILVTPLYAQQNSVQFNGMVFDTPPTAGSETPQTPPNRKRLITPRSAPTTKAQHRKAVSI